MTTKELFEVFSEFWALFLAVASGVGGYFTWRSKRQKSTLMLYNELEKLKQKVILQVAREVEQANILAEKEAIINQLRLKCPECYNKFIAKQKSNERD